MNRQMEEYLMKVTNKKTGDHYYVDDVVVDTTNELEPEEQVKILYRDDKAERFVKEAHEFFEEFDIPHGFNILSKACELAMQYVEEFHNECQPVEVDKVIWDSEKASLGPIKIVDNKEEISVSNSCSCGGECNCNNKKEYIGEMIDVDVYNTYRQTVENKWNIPLSIIKSCAYTQLKELFTIRCSDFDLVKKEYDNATSDYFLLGYKTSTDFSKNPCQVCKIPFKVFDRILNALKEEEQDDQFFND